PGVVNWEAIAETQRANRQVEAQANTKIGAEAIDRASRGKWGRSRAKAQFGLLRLVSERCDLIVPSGDVERLDSKRPRPGIDQANVGEERPARLLDDRKGNFAGGAPHRLTANRLVIRIFRADIPEPEATQIVRATEIQPIVNRHLRDLFCKLYH